MDINNLEELQEEPTEEQKNLVNQNEGEDELIGGGASDSEIIEE